jgi:hypothetical protein
VLGQSDAGMGVVLGPRTRGEGLRLAAAGPDRTNKADRGALSVMPRHKSPLTGPMSMQPAEHRSARPTPLQPMMPTTGNRPKKASAKKRSMRMEAVRAAKARMMRRDSLRKQRRAQRDVRLASALRPEEGLSHASVRQAGAQGWCRLRGLNSRPSVYKTAAA